MDTKTLTGDPSSANHQPPASRSARGLLQRLSHSPFTAHKWRITPLAAAATAVATLQTTAVRLLGLLLLGLLVSNCSGLGMGREPPALFLQSFRTVPGGTGGLPAFEITLRVLNPNPDPLGLEGAVYSVRLDGRRVIEGVTNDLDTIEGYGEGLITLTAGIDVIGGVRLLADLMNQPRDTVDYTLDARLDPVGFSRDIRIRETGQIELRPRSIRE